MYKDILKQIRVKQYTKNGLVFAAPLFAGKILDLKIFLMVFFAFLAFSASASIVYIINDIIDVKKDRQHPDKCKRPIASGVISISVAIGLAIGLFIIVIILLTFLNFHVGIILGLYLAINMFYSWKLKHIVIVDVMIIAFGFVLRALAGAAAINVVTTSWFALCVFMLSIFLALAKRRTELETFNNAKYRQRRVLHYYSIQLIDQLLTIVTAITITSYSLFALQEKNPYSIGGLSLMAFTIPMVIYGMFRYLYLVHVEKRGEKPEDVLLHDRHILGVTLLYTVTVIFIRSS